MFFQTNWKPGFVRANKRQKAGIPLCSLEIHPVKEPDPSQTSEVKLIGISRDAPQGKQFMIILLTLRGSKVKVSASSPHERQGNAGTDYLQPNWEQHCHIKWDCTRSALSGQLCSGH